MLVRPNIVIRKLRSLLIKSFHYLENNDNADFHRNGEEAFVRTLPTVFRNEKKVVLFDVGANVGKYTEILWKQLSQPGVEIHAFEPAASSFARLRESFDGNESIFLNNVGVSDTAGKATIFFDAQASALASLYRRNLKAYAITMDKTETIETIRLEDYIRSHAVSHIHLLKMDIEGHELSALNGLGTYLAGTFIDFIQFEYGGANLDSHSSLMELYELLESRGFRLAKIKRNGLELRGYVPWMDNFHYANYVAVSANILNRL